MRHPKSALLVGCLAFVACESRLGSDPSAGTSGSGSGENPTVSAGGGTADPSEGQSGAGVGTATTPPQSTTNGPTSNGPTTNGSTTNESTTGQRPCTTWCDAYPIEPGCDESGFGGGSAGGDDTGFGMSGEPPLAASVYDIKRDEVPWGTVVSLQNVVATSPDIAHPTEFGQRMFTVSDPRGGAYSGIVVRVDGDPGPLSVSTGDLLSIVAETDDRQSFPDLRTFDGFITTQGVGVPPEPVALDLETLAGFLDGGDDVRPYEGVLVSLPPTEVESERCAGELRLAYGGLRLDDRFLAAAGLSLPPATSFSGVGGPLLYSLNGFEIAPRSAEDLQP